MQKPRNPYSSAEIDRSSHERENEERMIELASSGAARFVPIDSERNLVNKGSGNPEPVFLQGMMARAVAGAADHHIFLGYVEGTPYFAVDVTGKETRISRRTIADIQPGNVSLMPAGFGEMLTLQELADLLAFLRAAR